ncbi:uncharacterized protein SPAPADRAFT_58922 [Spathaspora passalidarum NRRL Y-27907]|uniref:Uncharacterized protein n=1 Tax=Spathaspora passalidarum (strain NRRL Y-27907 / 11-Y1) TaxID=619300 RepID=G3AED6_SPAPN|nr:uncharacterized protein SPAPADRAFT_58922 [Spathaspora passalidarum NRRL Y-27907]EGW35724.1 hypothetical protein SPAPADRAFT_58922 [Spathaspora passalidarum NRRL Y-27907]
MPPHIAIPDLRFEQSFLKQLHKYAGDVQAPPPVSPNKLKRKHNAPVLTDAELQLMNHNLDVQEQQQLQPLPISTGIVVYAVIKDQIIMPLLQGFLLSYALLSIRPVLRLVVKNGQEVGGWVSRLIGLNRLGAGRVSVVKRS